MTLGFKCAENEITCPYCKTSFNDSWEYGDGDDKAECDECGKYFTWMQEVTVEYRSAKNCVINDEEHEFVEHSPGWQECSKCETHGFTPKRKAELQKQYRKDKGMDDDID